ncbi:TetR family transcriptional regulator [Actinoalloteichus sp. AHMU CJ021]|uniref:Transcriptional regulator, TetR family n=1 Tax=Actinoalloteichus caeruleus DSM 43889 TaxID=1120930 RepID=A0ABT1JBY7_ACTCY|nr:TetR family transcriptional regulator [Actinoalloteichus caeruleus]AUS80632.1 TetR family transcriptional regulator [Actinoalloteichus sp. AHMU CJ021]MCP2330015.1 transcriptional regulator, TetR family [Actinoalloteichus caeruleus DSM 43889]
MGRRGERRELLAEAAIEVLAAVGGRGLTHRAVDREARVPEGTTKNYFPSRESLLAAIADHLAEDHRAAVASLRRHTPESVTAGQLDALYRGMLRRSTGVGRSRLLALLELYLESIRRPSVRDALGSMALANTDATIALHESAGRRLTRAQAGRLDAYLLGLSLLLLALPADVLRGAGLDPAPLPTDAISDGPERDGGPGSPR